MGQYDDVTINYIIDDDIYKSALRCISVEEYFMDKQMDAIRALQNLTQNNVAWQKSTLRAMNEMKKVSSLYKNQSYSGAKVALEMFQKSLNIERLGIIQSSDLNPVKLGPAISVNTQLLSSAAIALQTSEITELVKGITNNQTLEAMQVFTKCLQLPKIHAANIGLLRINSAFLGVVNDWNGMDSFVKKINIPTAKILMQSDDIVIDTEKKAFVHANDDKCIAKNDEMNVIASSICLFEKITAPELMKLNDVLATNIEFAMTNPTAQKIFDILQKWDDYISFDRELYYRARKIEENQAPYTIKNFGSAPEKYVGYGRYNHDGQSHYYVASSENGACTEIRKHNRDVVMQVAKLKPKREVKMIDLSQKTDAITFLNHLRFEIDENEKVPRAYLLPCFITSCCKKTPIEGIKYYGSKEYDNYVTWESGYYDVISVSEPK